MPHALLVEVACVVASTFVADLAEQTFHAEAGSRDTRPTRVLGRKTFGAGFERAIQLFGACGMTGALVAIRARVAVRALGARRIAHIFDTYFARVTVTLTA